MGIFDLGQAGFSVIENLFAMFPPSVRVAFWGFWSAIFSIAVYSLLSPQKRLAALVLQIAGAKLQLVSQEPDDFSSALKIYKHTVHLALQRLLLTLGPTLVAALPLLFVIAWLSANFSYRFPDRNTLLPAAAQPAEFPVVARNMAGEPQKTRPPYLRIMVLEKQEAILTFTLQHPIPVIEKRRWWHFFFGNLNGYLPPNAPVERISVQLPTLEILPVGPDWLRGWEPLYFAVLFLFSAIFKAVGRLK